ncbi:MAG: hypothetical protein U0V03_01040 [Bacteroidia bacterium]
MVDYLFIGVILYGKNLDSFSCYFLLLIPFFNAPNHSGEKNAYYTYLFALITVFIIDEYSLRLNHLFPFLIILIIDAFSRIRTAIQRINETLFEIIDSFYAKNIGRKETSKIYESLIGRMSSIHLTKSLRTESISSFVIRKESLLLVNSSMNIFDYDIKDIENLLPKLNSGKIVENHAVYINNTKYERNLLTKVTGNTREYVFFVTFKKVHISEIQSLKVFFIGRLILIPALKHIARLFEVQYSLIKSKAKNLDILRENQEYVLKANEAMHFVKNSLSPIKSTLTTLDLIDNEQDESNKKYLLESLEKQRIAATNEIANIIKRANLILDKAKNPFESTNIEEVEFYSLFNTIRRRWSEAFNTKNITINNNVDYNENKLASLFFFIDINTLHLLISNVFSNIDKYSNNDNSIIFDINKDDFTISFINGIDFSKVQLNELKNIALSYNENKRNEIAKRQSHGFVHLRLYTEALEAESRILIKDDKYYILELKLNYSNENNNI